MSPLPKRDEERFWQDLKSFVGRMANTDDPREHQAAAAQLQKNLQTVRWTGH